MVLISQNLQAARPIYCVGPISIFVSGTLAEKPETQDIEIILEITLMFPTLELNSATQK